MKAPPSFGPGTRVLVALDRAISTVEYLTAIIAGVVIFFVMWVGVFEIFSRKLFNAPLYGQLDVIELTMAYYALLPISYCWRAAGHIRVDLVISRFAGRSRWIIELLTTLSALALVTAILPGVLHFFENAYEIGDSTINTQWPTWPSKVVPIFGFAILWCRLLLETFGFLRLIANPTATPVAIPVHHDVIEEAVAIANAAAAEKARPLR